MQGVNSNLEIVVKSTTIFRDPARDICILEVLSLPPFKDITKFWAENNFPISRILSLQRDKHGYVAKRNVYNVYNAANFPVETLQQAMQVYTWVS